MSNRLLYALAVALLMIAALFRLHDLALLPPGLSPDEIDNVRIVETARMGTIETFYNLRGEGREPLYPVFVAASTTLTGSGLLGYRLFSVWTGMIALAVVYTLGKRLFGGITGLASIVLLAVGFFPVLLDRAILPESLLPLLVAATLLALAQSLSVYPTQGMRVPNSLSFAALGVLLGLGFYVHPLHFLLVLAVMVFIVYIVVTRQPISRNSLSFTSFGILVMIILAMPYLIASIRQPQLASARRVIEGYDQSMLLAIVNGIVGIFFRGDSNPIYNLPERPLFDLVSGFMILIGLFVAVRGWRQPRYALLLIPLMITLPFAFLTPDSPDFLRFAPLLPLLALLFGVGVKAMIASLRPRSLPFVMAGLAVLLLFNVVWAGRDLFQTWRELPAARTAYQSRLGLLAHYLDSSAGSLPTVVCTPELYPQNDAPVLISAQLLALMMHRQNTLFRYADCGSGLVLANGGEAQQLIFPEVGGLERMNPYLRRWVDMGSLQTSDNLPSESVVILDVSTQLADTIGRFTTTAPASYAPETGGTNFIAQTPVRFGGNIAFLGYDRVAPDVFAPGAVVPIYTYWRVDGIVPSDLRFFTHLLSDPQVIARQADTLSVRADLLQLRDVIVQATLIQLPFTIPPGTYILSVGAYESGRGTRLGVFDGNQLRGDRLFIGTIQISR